MSDAPTIGVALGRAGLLGNPSDGYGGRVIATTLPAMKAQVTLTASPRWVFVAADGSESTHAAVTNIATNLPQLDGGAQLLASAVVGLSERYPGLVAKPARLKFETTIPRQVGLSGSSAIVIAAMRALATRANGDWKPVALAREALFAETKTLGWAAGPQDRVVQAYEGVLDMDFARAWHARGYVRLEPRRLPPLFVAWQSRRGQPSNEVHSEVRDRWLSEDPVARNVMFEFARLAAKGRVALEANEAAGIWPRLLNRAFELRQELWQIDAGDEQLVAAGRSHRAGVALAGSGGAVVGAVANAQEMGAIEGTYRRLGAGFVALTP